MKLNIVRQPLTPAFLTLSAVAATAMWQVGDTPTEALAVSAGSVRMPGELLLQFQAAFPTLSRILAGLMIVWSGLSLGRLSVRYGFYAVNNCLAIPLYGIIACAILPGGNYLATYTASLFLTLSVQQYCRACRNGYGFEPIFRASFYLGILPFVYPAALPLVLMMPLAVLVFRRTLRELVVATAGLFLPLLTVCYVGWGTGYDFPAPLVKLWSGFVADCKPFHLFTSSAPETLIFASAFLILTLASVAIYLSHSYTTGSKPRFLLTYNIGILLLCILMASSPSADRGVIALFAIPAALFVPMLLVRINHVLATPIYLVLLVVAFVNLFMQ